MTFWPKHILYFDTFGRKWLAPNTRGGRSLFGQNQSAVVSICIIKCNKTFNKANPKCIYFIYRRAHIVSRQRWSVICVFSIYIAYVSILHSNCFHPGKDASNLHTLKWWDIFIWGFGCCVFLCASTQNRAPLKMKLYRYMAEQLGIIFFKWIFETLFRP